MAVELKCPYYEQTVFYVKCHCLKLLYDRKLTSDTVITDALMAVFLLIFKEQIYVKS